MRIRPDRSAVRVRALRPRPRHALRREGDERRIGADWRGDRNRTDRDVDGGERRGFLLHLRVAPTQRRCGDRGLARSEGEPGPAAHRRCRDERYFRVRLLQLEFDRPAAVRIQGLAIGIDVGDEDYADTIHHQCRRNGLLVSTEGSTVLLLPSLAIDKPTAAKGLDILARSM
jgi:hypothetical protein